MISLSAFIDEMEKIAVSEATRASVAEKRGLSVPEHRLAMKARTAATTHNRRLSNEAHHLSDSIFLRRDAPDVQNYYDKTRHMRGSGERAKVRRHENDLKARYPQPVKHPTEGASSKETSSSPTQHEAKTSHTSHSPKEQVLAPQHSASKAHVPHSSPPRSTARSGMRMGAKAAVGVAALGAGALGLRHLRKKRNKQ